MSFVEITRSLAGLGSFFLTFGLYSQLYKIWKTKSAGDLSPLAVAAIIYIEITYCAYGIGLGEWPMWLSAGVNTPAAIGIAFLYKKYHNTQPVTDSKGETNVHH